MVEKKPPAEIVNLRRVRKERARMDAKGDADARRLQHGRAKAEKSLTQARNEKAQRDLGGHRKDQDGADSES